jgi:hypothetical protein
MKNWLFYTTPISDVIVRCWLLFFGVVVGGGGGSGGGVFVCV